MKQSSNKKEVKQSCSLWTIILTLIVILVLLLSAIAYIKVKNGFIGLKDVKKSQPVNIGLEENLKKQLENQKGEDTITLSVSEADLTEALNINDKNFPLKNPSVTILPENILLSGKTSDSVFSFKLSVSIVPKVENGKVIMDIKEIKTGGVAAPKVVVDQVSGGLKNYLSQFSPLSNDVNVEKVSLSTGYLKVSGKRK